MFMPFDRRPQPHRPARFTPMPDATGTPTAAATARAEWSRPATGDSGDFREQADGAP